MKIIVLTQQTAFVRHWFKWYRVQRAGEDWRPLEVGKQYVKPKKFDLEKTAAKLAKKYPPKPTA
jgi:hypothetical protein